MRQQIHKDNISKLIKIPIDEGFPYFPFFLFLFLVPITIFFIVSFYEGTLYMGKTADVFFLSGTDDIGLLENPIRIFTVLMHSIIIFLIVRISKLSYSLLDSIRNVVDESALNIFEKHLCDFKAMMNFDGGEYIKKRILAHMCGGAVFIFQFSIYFFRLEGYDFSSYWSDVSHPLGFLAWVTYLGVIYLFFYPLCIWFIISIIISIRRLFRALLVNDIPKIKLIPFAFDKAGGLGNIGKIALNIDLLLIPPMLLLFLYIFIHKINHIIVTELLLFPPLCLVLFFSPLRSVHQVMKKAKSIEIGNLTKEYNSKYYKFRALFPHEGFNMDEKANELYESLSRLKELILVHKDIPEWPFNTQIFVSFFFSFLFPFLILFSNII